MNKFYIIIAASVVILAYTIMSSGDKPIVPTVNDLLDMIRVEKFNASIPAEVPVVYGEDVFIPDKNVISEYSHLTLEDKNIDMSKVQVGELNENQSYIYEPTNIGGNYPEYNKDIASFDSGSGDLEMLNRQFGDSVREEYFKTLEQLERRGGNSHIK